MTVGIGVLASSRAGIAQRVAPDHLIFTTDTMGSFGDEFSHSRLHKRWDLPNNNLYVIAAGRIDKASEVVPMIDGYIGAKPPTSRSYGDILTAIGSACFFYKSEMFKQQVLPKHRMPPEFFDPRTIPQHLDDILKKEWGDFDLGFDLVVGAFDNRGQAHLISVEGAKGTAEVISIPGFCAIGTGAPNAMYWLAHRGHTLGMAPLRALYHAYEAKVMAEDAPNVNDHIDVLVASAESHWWCTSHTPFDKQRTIQRFPLDSLREMFKKYGPRDTKALDDKDIQVVMSSISQKSEPGQ